MLCGQNSASSLLILLTQLLHTALAQDDLSSLAEAIPGIPGEDFPIFGELPSSSFLCDGRQQGYYADPEVRQSDKWDARSEVVCQADCQMFHICVDEDQLTPPLTDYAFLCPNGTLFRKSKQSRKYFLNSREDLDLGNYKEFYFDDFLQSTIFRLRLVVQCGLLLGREFLQSKRASFWINPRISSNNPEKSLSISKESLKPDRFNLCNIPVKSQGNKEEEMLSNILSHIHQRTLSSSNISSLETLQ